MLRILCLLHSYIITYVRWIWNGSFSIRKACEEEKARLSTINVSWRIQNFTMLAMKSAENNMPQLNKKRKVKKPSKESYWSPATQIENWEAEFKFAANSGSFLAHWFGFRVLHLSYWAPIKFFDGFLPFSFYFASAYCFQRFSLRALWSSTSSIIRL